VSGGRDSYDAVVVGARCAGTPVAARLARQGWKVLLLDRDPPPADTLSTHAVFPNTLARLAELGALERIEREHRVNLVEYAIRTFGHESVGRFTPIGGFDRMAVITRPVLDSALLAVAVDAGAETRFGEKVTGLLGAGTDEDPARGVILESGEEIEARWVLGADGRVSTVARLLGLEKERQMRAEMAFMFTYWRGLPHSDRFKIDVIEEGSLVWSPMEDDFSILILGLDPLLTRGDAARAVAPRRRRTHRSRGEPRRLRGLPRRTRPRALRVVLRLRPLRQAGDRRADLPRPRRRPRSRPRPPRRPQPPAAPERGCLHQGAAGALVRRFDRTHSWMIICIDD